MSLHKSLLFIIIAAFLVQCSPDGSGPKDVHEFDVQVLNSLDFSPIENANVVLYNADNNEALNRKSTDNNGKSNFNIGDGNYYVKISAQGFKSSPPENNSPIPFSVVLNEDIVRTLYLDPLAIPQPGQISGSVNPILNNVLIVASQTGGTEFTTVSGPDGYFALYNLPLGQYTLQAFKEGFESIAAAQADVTNLNTNISVSINIRETTGALLIGKVSFLASSNYFVDISLINPTTFSAIPGLSTVSDTASAEYEIAKIPSGTFKAWASFKNDGYIMDPDWIYKNPGVLDVSFSEYDTLILDFSVTGAITIYSPTNPADSVYAVVADSSIPTFSWELYSSTKEYIIEVRKLNGDIIWGGYNTDGTINHPKLGQEVDSVLFNFDGSATENLIPGEIYQWKVYADDGKDPNIQTLISASEDLLGIFEIPN